jgi:hypothetical protein
MGQLPSIAYLDFASGDARPGRSPRDEDVIVIDNFWHAPDSLRARALRTDFHQQLSDSGFSFRADVAPPLLLSRSVDLVARVIGQAAVRTYCEGRIVAETAADEGITRQKTWVHFDEWKRVGVLYLSLPEDAKGGTDFFQHKETGCASIRQVRSKAQRRVVFKDSTHDAAWDVVHHVEMRYNRMVLFCPQFFHQATC